MRVLRPTQERIAQKLPKSRTKSAYESLKGCQKVALINKFPGQFSYLPLHPQSILSGCS